MKHLFNAILIMVAIAIVLPGVAFSQDYFSGKIQGANYVFNNGVQPTSSSDPKINLERDFVLQAEDGSVYFLKNVPRYMKVKAINKDVRVYGKNAGNGKIMVHHIDYKIGDKYVALCNWKKKMQDLSRGN